MKTSVKKWLSLLLALMMLVGMVPAAALDVEEEECLKSILY